MDPDDATLISQTLVARDLRAFDDLVARHQSYVRCLLRRLTREEALADDLAQETFLTAYRQLANFRGDARFTTWLHRIAYHAFLAHRRSRHGRRDDPPLDENASDEAVESTARRSDLRHDLEFAMSHLSEPERAAITLCLGSGLTHPEAAEVMQIPAGTVKTHLLRGREKLRTLLAEWGT